MVFGVQTVAMFDMITLHTSLLLISVLSQSFFNPFLNRRISSHKKILKKELQMYRIDCDTFLGLLVFLRQSEFIHACCLTTVLTKAEKKAFHSFCCIVG